MVILRRSLRRFAPRFCSCVAKLRLRFTPLRVTRNPFISDRLQRVILSGENATVRRFRSRTRPKGGQGAALGSTNILHNSFVDPIVATLLGFATVSQNFDCKTLRVFGELASLLRGDTKDSLVKLLLIEHTEPRRHNPYELPTQ